MDRAPYLSNLWKSKGVLVSRMGWTNRFSGEVCFPEPEGFQTHLGSCS